MSDLASATFDGPHRVYRYTLRRSWLLGAGIVCWVMLNPSTADEYVLDPTLRRVRGYTEAWGYRGFSVVNLYALRSTDPKGLWTADDPIGPGNDDAIEAETAAADLVIVGWGTNAKPERVEAVLPLLGRNPHCLRTTKDGSPSHPLYLPKTLTPVRWEPKL